MNKQTATLLVTAFDSFEQLTAACGLGYHPTLTPGDLDGLDVQRAKTILTHELESRGYVVFTGNAK